MNTMGRKSLEAGDVYPVAAMKSRLDEHARGKRSLPVVYIRRRKEEG